MLSYKEEEYDSNANLEIYIPSFLIGKFYKNVGEFILLVL